MNKPVRIIYIAGSSHSGSTILDLVLGSHSAVESVGEAKKIPEILSRIAAGERPLCTCQQALSACPLWSDLLARDLGDLRRNAAANERLYRLVLEKQRKSVILDSSKTLGRALLLARSELFEPVFVHLVRDSRAVAFSSKRKKIKHGPGGYGLLETARGWQKLNARIPKRLRAVGAAPPLLVRYENFVADPQATLEKILGAAGLAWEPAMLGFREHIHHNIEGNRMRMGSGAEIKGDDEYLRSLSAAEWWLVTLLTWRGLRNFGYPLKRSPVAPEAGGIAPSLR